MLNLDVFPSEMLRGCLVVSPTVFITLYSILHDDCSHIEDVHLPFCAHLINIFLFLTGVEHRHFFLPRCLWVAYFV